MPAGRGPCHGHRWSPYSHVKPGTQEGAAERVDVAPRAAINRRPKDIGQLFGRQITICKPAVALEKYSQYLSRFSSAVEQRFCKPKVGSSILSTGTTISYLAEMLQLTGSELAGLSCNCCQNASIAGVAAC